MDQMRLRRCGVRPGTVVDPGGDPPPLDLPYADADLNTAYAFQQEVLSHITTGDRHAQLVAAFPDLKTYLDVGHTGSPAAGSTHPNWNGSAAIAVPSGSSDFTIDGYDVEGDIFIALGRNRNVIINNCRLSRDDVAFASWPNHNCLKQNGDTYTATITNSTLRRTRAAAITGLTNVANCDIEYHRGDNIKAGHTAGASVIQRIENSWLQAAGWADVYDAAIHGDAFQVSGGGDVRAVALGVYSAGSSSTYTTSGHGLTQAFRVDANLGNCFRVHCLGMMAAFGGIYPIYINSQNASYTTRNVTMAFCTIASPKFRDPTVSDTGSLFYPNSLAPITGGLENIGFYGNQTIYQDDTGPLLYNGSDVTGIWRWKKATMDAATTALWQDLGLLDGSGDPVSGMLRSTAP